MTASAFLITLIVWWSVFFILTFTVLRFRLGAKVIDAFSDSTVLSSQGYTWLVGLLALPAIVALPFLSGAVGGGDAAFYNTQIATADLDGQYIHFGYFLLGRILYLLLPTDVDALLNVFAYVQGIAVSVVLYFIFAQVTGSRLAAALCAVSFSSAAVSIYSYVYSEVYVTGLLLCLLAWYSLRQNYALLAGLCFAIALSVSILNIVFAPLFLYAVYTHNTLHWSRALLFTLAVSLPLLVFTVFFFDGLMYGDRGILTGAGASSSLAEFIAGWNASIKILLGSFPLLLPFAILGGLNLLRAYGVKGLLWSIPFVMTLVVHALTAGALHEWGLDLLITPLLSLLCMAFLVPKAIPLGVFTRLSRSHRFVIFAVALLCNTLCGLSLWSNGILTEARKDEARYEVLAGQIVEDGHTDVIEHVVPIGTFAKTGMFLRAVDRPYNIASMSKNYFNSSAQAFVILDVEYKKEFDSANVDQYWHVSEYKVDNETFWLLIKKNVK